LKLSVLGIFVDGLVEVLDNLDQPTEMMRFHHLYDALTSVDASLSGGDAPTFLSIGS
jgi:hypothetical protein